MDRQVGNYVCGWCNATVQRSEVFSSRFTVRGFASNELILKCVSCGRLSYEGKAPEDSRYLQWPKPDATLTLATDALPEEVDLVWQEVRSCIRAGAPMATATMLRTLIIAIWRNQNKGENKAANFFEALDALEKSDMLTKPLRDRADKLRVLGNDAVHEVKPPEQEDLEAATKTAHLWLRVMYEDVPQD